MSLSGCAQQLTAKSAVLVARYSGHDHTCWVGKFQQGVAMRWG
jgi:hypothetical protein